MSDRAGVVVEAAATGAVLPGREVVARIRRLLVLSLITVSGYSWATTAGRAHCPGGMTVDSSGATRYLDADQRITDAVPTCANLALGPTWVVPAAIAVIVLVTLGRVLRHSATERDAGDRLRRAGLAIGALAIGAVLVAHAVFWSVPLLEWDGGELSYPASFPVGSIELTIKELPIG
jgi:hypothetical protein